MKNWLTSMLKNALFNILSFIIILILFSFFGLILYYNGYDNGIEKATTEYNKQRDRLIKIVQTPCQKCKVLSEKYQNLSDKVLKKTIYIHDFNEKEHTIEEYKQFLEHISNNYLKK